jgi:hypothetical protein
VATAYGVVIGFSIIFLFGEFSDARQAIGNEATSIGTAFDEALLFPEATAEIQHALICYSRAVPEFDWPALRDGSSAPQVDDAYTDLVLSMANLDQSATATFEPAAATNMFVQIGSISTARETRLVSAETEMPDLLWGLIIGGGLFAISLIFVVTLTARPSTQGFLVGSAAVFTLVMILIVVALSSPFANGAGSLSPKLIEQTTASMEQDAPEVAAQPCNFEQAG